MTVHSVDTGDISGGVLEIDGDALWKGVAITAGDTFEFTNGTYTCQVLIHDCVGTLGNEITFTNTGGQVYIPGAGNDSWRFRDNSYCIIDGTGHGGTTYGFRFGDHVDSRGQDTESINVEIKYCQFDRRLLIYQVSSAEYPMKDYEIHHNFFNNYTAEACYIGSANYTFASSNYEMWDFLIHDNIFDGTDEQLQLRGHVKDHPVHVYDNTFTNTEYLGAITAAIQFGRGTHGYVYRNLVKDHEGLGFFFLGGERDATFVSEVYNNIFVRTGTNGGLYGHGARVRDGGNVDIKYNTFVTCGKTGAGYGVRADEADDTVNIIGNIILDTEAGDAITGGNDVRDNLTDTAADSEDNTAYSIADMKFTDSASDDYHIESDSPAVGAGNTIDAPSLDYDEVVRGNPPDVGAYEYLSGTPPYVYVVYTTVTVQV